VLAMPHNVEKLRRRIEKLDTISMAV